MEVIDGVPCAVRRRCVVGRTRGGSCAGIGRCRGRGGSRARTGLDRLGPAIHAPDRDRAEQQRRGRIRRPIEPEGDRQRGPERVHEEPASAKPMTSAIVSPTHIAEFAVSSSSGRTMRGRIAIRAGSEEDRDRRQEEHERVDEQDVRDDGQRDQQHDRRAQQVADDKDFLVIPPIDERARDRADEEVRESWRSTNTIAVASGDPVTTRTDAASATWWIRSPNSEISWPGPQAGERAVEREPDVGVPADPLERLR